MKKYLFYIVFLPALLCFAACSDDNDIDEPVVPPTITNVTEGVYIINEFNPMAGELSQLSFYNKEDGTLAKDIFLKQNEIPLGVGAQDILTYGSKMYITVTNSNNICITDLNAKLLKYKDGSVAKIKSSEAKEGLDAPRRLIAHDGYVYASYWSGHVAKIDTTKMEIVDITSNSENYKYFEEMTIVGNKLYVPETQDKRNRISVINLTSFKEEQAITVAENPMHIINDNSGNVYTLSADWSTTPYTFTFTRIENNKVADTQAVAGNEIVSLGDELVLMEVTYGAKMPKFSFYNTKTKEIKEQVFTTGDQKLDMKLQNAYKIAVDPNNQDFYIVVSEYGSEGEVFVFDKNRKYKSNFKAGGLSPVKVHFSTTVNSVNE